MPHESAGRVDDEAASAADTPCGDRPFQAVQLDSPCGAVAVGLRSGHRCPSYRLRNILDPYAEEGRDGADSAVGDAGAACALAGALVAALVAPLVVQEDRRRSRGMLRTGEVGQDERL